MHHLRITKLFTFEMSHALYNYEGPCRNIHGHSYRMEVTVSGKVKDIPGAPDDGMIMDFSVLKSIVQSRVLNEFDHSLVLNAAIGEEAIAFLKSTTLKLVILPYQPSCENLTSEFASRIRTALPGDIQLYSLRLYETATAFAEWVGEE